MRCAVSNCGNSNRCSNKKNWRFFHFPKNGPHLQKWIDFCMREDVINTSTACICQEHFRAEDFERNLKYELGFTRINPTKLKPGSYPTIRRTGKQSQRHKNQTNRTPASRIGNSDNSTELSENIYCDPASMISKHANVQEDMFKPTDDDDYLEADNKQSDRISSEYDLINNDHTYENLNIEILDPSDPCLNINYNAKADDNIGDTYVRHLENEVSALRREVFFLKDERENLLREVKSLRQILEQTGKVPKIVKVIKPALKNPVVLYRANLQTIKKLRQINKSSN
ncbi:uncharacterized protein LOC115623029 [Scaptodrosophila lebanonensis]|uniref:Uncharacterized protein LOC115623029 n=1 Tax=Drosophila lebanonensis TaxID=7225 RepID=A0A6J2TD65_DROLE|nr:uncharacterized protein LOC115623029 [Scaptodrosophila lebanonensis]